MSRGRRRGVAIAVLAALAVLSASAVARAASDPISSPDEFGFAGGTGPGGEFRLDAGSRAQLLNTDSDAPHDIVAGADGPDGERLFETELLQPGASAPLAGTEYLTPGAYPFFCTIHFNMNGTLLVEGAAALPRPSVELAIRSSKLRRVRNGKLVVSVSADAASADVSLTARLGNRTLATASGLELAAGERRAVSLRLARPARRALADLKRAKVTVSGDVPYGAPASAKRRLR